MRVLFTSTAGQGHFQPLVPLIRACEDAGHEVKIVAPNALSATLAALGSSYELCDGPEPDVRAAFWAKVDELPRKESSKLIEQEWFAGLCLDSMRDVVLSVAKDWQPDLIIRETCEYAAAIVADQHGITQWQVGISTAKAESRVLYFYVADILNSHSPGLGERLFAVPYLTKFPPSLDPSTYPNTIRVRERSEAAPSALPDWWKASTDPLLYVTLGTVAMRSEGGRSLLKHIVQELQSYPARILVTTGTSDDIDLGEVNESVHVESWVDQASVVANADLVICHGGSGTVFGALFGGVPLVVLPMFADQPTNGRLVAEAGAGISLGAGERSLEENTADLVKRVGELPLAVSTILSTRSYKTCAEAIAAEMQKMETPSAVVQRLAG